MTRLLFIALLALSISPVACSQQTAGTAAPSSSAATASSSTATTEDTDDRPVYTKDECRFRIAEPENQHYAGGVYMFDPNDKGRNNGWGFGFRCYYGASQEEIRSRLEIERVDGEWYSTAYHKPFTPEQNFKMYHFSGTNWEGKATAISLQYGPPESRVRFLQFCLIQDDGPQVMCGRKGTKHLYPPSKDKRPIIMDVLKTIEFVEPDEVPASSGTRAIP